MLTNDIFKYFAHGFKVVFIRPRRISQILKNLYYDLKYAKSYLGIPVGNENSMAGFTNTTSTEYDVLEKLFSKIQLNDTDVIVDVGCGKGRVLAWLISQRIQNKIIGVEVDPVVSFETKKRMRFYKQTQIVTGDITADVFPYEGTIFYMFNPFDKFILEKFLRKLEANLLTQNDPKKHIVIIYYNCCHLDVFENNKLWHIENAGVYYGLPAAIITTRLT